MPKILISYRRSDSAAITGRIYDRLIGRYGPQSVFMDIDSIPFGIDYRHQVHDKLVHSDVVIAVVGAHWLGTNADGSTRIVQEDDPVRIEIETALQVGATLVPVLADGASMPSARELPEALQQFAYLNAASIESSRDFNHQMDRLIGSVDRILQGLGRPPGDEVAATGATKPPTRPQWHAWAAVAGAVIAAAVLVGLMSLRNTGPIAPPPVVATATFQKGQIAKKGVDDAIHRLQALLVTQRINLLPSVDSYLKNPSAAAWLAVRQDVAEITDLIRDAMRAVIEYDVGLTEGLGPQLQAISGLLRSRRVMVNEIYLSETPMTPEELRQWQVDYRKLVSELNTELTALRARMN